MDIFKVSAATVVLLATAFLVFRQVGADYLSHSKLTPLSTFLETLVFFLHGAGSYFFLDSDLLRSDHGRALTSSSPAGRTPCTFNWSRRRSFHSLTSRW